MTNEDRLFELVKSAVELAIVRHGLTAGDDEIDDAHREEIAIDTWNALRGYGTCDAKESPEFRAVKEAFQPFHTEAYKSTGSDPGDDPDNVGY
jgi:hypothetical protein